MNTSAKKVVDFTQDKTVQPIQKQRPSRSPLQLTIAIDGPAGAGKGTIGRRLAEEVGCDFLDTGSLYRTVALMMVNTNGNVNNKNDVAFAIRTAKKYMTPELLEQPELRSEEVSAMSSKVAVISEVRQALLETQQEFAKNPPKGRGAILDGRDIGTVICPDADIKLFVTATPEIRAKRRFEDMKKLGKHADYEEILKSMKERDIRDSTRDIAPGKPADDAIIIDTSECDIEEAFAKTLQTIRNHMISQSKML